MNTLNKFFLLEMQTLVFPTAVYYRLESPSSYRFYCAGYILILHKPHSMILNIAQIPFLCSLP